MAGDANVKLDALRGTAALLVAGSHARTLLLVDYDNAAKSWWETGLYATSALGHQAVIVFFVLSGFWVGGSAARRIKDNRFDATPYGVARMTRMGMVLLPALGLTAILDGVGRWVNPASTGYRGSALYGGVVSSDPSAYTPLAALGNALFLGGIRVRAFGSNTALWSVGFESWLYILGPAALIVVSSRSIRTKSIGAMVVVGSSIVVGLPVLVYLPIWLSGILVVPISETIKIIAARCGQRHWGLVQLAVGASLAAAMVAARGGSRLPLWTTDYFLTIPTVLFIAVLVPFSSISSWNLPGRGLASIGRFSFSLYAIHTPLLILLIALLHLDASLRWAPDALHWSLLTAVLVALCAAGLLFARLTEWHTQEVRAVIMNRLRAP